MKTLLSALAVLALAATALAMPSKVVTWSGASVLVLDGGVPDGGAAVYSDPVGIFTSTAVYAVCTLSSMPTSGSAGLVTLQASNDNVVWLDWPGTATVEDAGSFSIGWALTMPAPFVRVAQTPGTIDGGTLSCTCSPSGL